MHIQEISLSNNLRKKLFKALCDDSVMFQEENGDLVVHAAAYQHYKDETETAPIEDILSEDADGISELENKADYFVFS